MKKCPFCAEDIADGAIKCKHCGSMLVPAQGGPPPPVPVQAVGAKIIVASNPPKDPVLMGLLSFCCVAGIGQIVLGQVNKGIVILLVSVVLGVVTGGLSALITTPLGGIDAYLIAKKLKEGGSVGEWDFLPN